MPVAAPMTLGGDTPDVDLTENCAAGAGYAISMWDARYHNHGQTTQRRHWGVVQHVLERDAPLDLACDASASGDFRTLPNLLFVNAETPVRVRWGPGNFRRLLCEMDLDRLMTEACGLAPLRPLDVQADLNLQSPFIAIMMRRLAEELISPGFASDLQIESTVLSIGIELRRTLTRGSVEESDTDQLGRRQLSALHGAIEAAPATVSLRALAEVCGIPARRLSPLYRRATGTTLRASIAEARVRRAEARLVEPEVMIKQIAHECGFRSTAAFDAAFRRVTGMTPVRYREVVCRSLRPARPKAWPAFHR